MRNHSFRACLYTTGMRNSEIKKISMADIQLIDGCRFISVKKSKTQNGVRLVPQTKYTPMAVTLWNFYSFRIKRNFGIFQFH
ncbi:MAG: hypothetical protein LBQ93_03510 [Treponema sp.]|nr:hypothetical protein [Treponema sp.]